ncbi:hypothetical protein M3J09_011253 [Ascochyta lentis]
MCRSIREQCGAVLCKELMCLFVLRRR